MEFVITKFLGEAFRPSVFLGDGLRGRKDSACGAALGRHLGFCKERPLFTPQGSPGLHPASEGGALPPSRQSAGLL